MTKAIGAGFSAPSACARSVVQLDGATQRTRMLAIVVAQDGQDILRERAFLQLAVRDNDVDLVARRAEHPQLGVDHHDAVDIGSLRGAAEQFADRHDVGGRDRLHDVGALRDAFKPRGSRSEQADESRARQPRFAVETLAELLLRQAAQLLGLPLQSPVEPHDRQAERGRESDRRRRNDRDDQPGTE